MLSRFIVLLPDKYNLYYVALRKRLGGQGLGRTYYVRSLGDFSNVEDIGYKQVYNPGYPALSLLAKPTGMF